MNPEEPNDEISEMLRSSKPLVIPPAGLEARILRSLAPPERPRAIRFWPWLLLPPAVAVGVVLLQLQPSPQQVPPVVRIDPPPVHTPPPRVSPVRWKNPLESEASALQRDVRRAGHFLIHCLPSVPTPAE